MKDISINCDMNSFSTKSPGERLSELTSTHLTFSGLLILPHGCVGVCIRQYAPRSRQRARLLGSENIRVLLLQCVTKEVKHKGHWAKES
jgi:hypothetical protein